MLRSDLLTSEIKKLAMVLARIIGMKIEDPDQRFTVFENEANKHFKVTLSELLEDPEASLSENLKLRNMQAEQIDMLSKFVMHMWLAKPESKYRTLILKLYDLLETEYKYYNFEFEQNRNILK